MSINLKEAYPRSVDIAFSKRFLAQVESKNDTTLGRVITTKLNGGVFTEQEHAYLLGFEDGYYAVMKLIVEVIEAQE